MLLWQIYHILGNLCMPHDVCFVYFIGMVKSKSNIRFKTLKPYQSPIRACMSVIPLYTILEVIAAELFKSLIYEKMILVVCENFQEWSISFAPYTRTPTHTYTHICCRP